MIPNRLEEISESDLVTLISNGVAEGRTIEYKRDLPGGSDGDKKEFLADVSSFSNTGGGDLVFGVEENHGVPTQITGLQSADIDLEIRRLESILASGLDPRIRFTTRVVNCSGDRRTLIIRVERSWFGPHRVVFKGHDRFYGRNSAGKYPLDVNELREAFTLSSTVVERIRAFRTDRIIDLTNNLAPVPFAPGPKIVLHCIPIESFAGQTQYDVLQFEQDPLRLRPMGTTAWNHRLNLEGWITYDAGSPCISYSQFYRNGIIEAVNGRLLAQEHQGVPTIPSVAYEKSLFEYLPSCLGVLKRVGATVPIVIALTLTNTRGLRMGVSRFPDFGGYPIEKDSLILPERIVQDFSTAPGEVMKPIFDLIWNACGHAGSLNFDNDGKWVPRQ